MAGPRATMTIVSRRQAVLATLFLMTAPQHLSAGDGSAYEELVRQYLIAHHCELVTSDVMNGFRIEIMTLLDSGSITATQAQAGRRAAGEAVRQEWRNRGQGARDPRCRSEGRAAAARFVGVLHDGD